MADICVGISFGTASCCIAVHREGTAVVIPDSQGFRTTPSYIAFTDTGVLIGRPARDQFPSNPSNTVHNFKQFLGRKYSDILTHINLTHLTYRVVQGPDDWPLTMVTVEGQEQRLSLPDILALLFRHLKAIAESYLCTTISKAVLAVPPYFTDTQRMASKDAGTLAGLNILRLINEPTSACIAYELNTGNTPGETYAITVDLGAGEATATMEVLEEGIFEVREVASDKEVSGDEIDKRLVEYCTREWRNNTQFDGSEFTLKSLQLQCQYAKCALSSQSQATIRVDNCSITVTRAQFERLIEGICSRLSSLIARVLANAHISSSAFRHVVLSGGCVRIPAFQRLLERIFPESDICRHHLPEGVIAFGCSIQAAILLRPYPPCQLMCIMEVCLLSLGVEVAGGLMHSILLRNTTCPCRKTYLFTTVIDYQHTVEIDIYEGERAFVRDNHYLASVSLAGLIPRPKGFPDIEVTFEIDINTVLYVTATDPFSHITATVTCPNDAGRLSIGQIEAMFAATELNAEKDRTDRLLAELASSRESRDTGIRRKAQLSIAYSPS